MSCDNLYVFMRLLYFFFVLNWCQRMAGENCCFNASRIEYYLDYEPHPSSVKNLRHLFQSKISTHLILESFSIVCIQWPWLLLIHAWHSLLVLILMHSSDSEGELCTIWLRLSKKHIDLWDIKTSGIRTWPHSGIITNVDGVRWKWSFSRRDGCGTYSRRATFETRVAISWELWSHWFCA